MNSKYMLIAEIGHNWTTYDELFRLVDSAAENGATHAKVQLYDTDKIKKPGDTNYDQLKNKELSRLDYYAFVMKCRSAGIKSLASVFDVERLDWVLSEGQQEVKLASRSFVDNKLNFAIDSSKQLKKVIKTIPHCYSDRITSIGAHRIDKTKFLYSMSRREIIANGFRGLPKSFSGDPELFDGYSCHAIGTKYAVQAYNRGATIVEKHFTFDQNYPGWDQPASMTPAELRLLSSHLKEITANEQE